MKTASQCVRLLGIMVLSLTMGCASAYHDYSECRINCRYCAPPPLPYMQYNECVCHSCAASKYLMPVTAPTPAEALPGEGLE
jgi:hypothetical protein